MAITKSRIRHWIPPPIYEILPGWCFPNPLLRFKAYCVGLPKTGTLSLHAMFHQGYRSAHEPTSRFLIHKMLAFTQGKMSQSEWVNYVKCRDRWLALEMDSSSLNYYLIEVLVEEFKTAKFILTIRDCYSWCDSLINHCLTHPNHPWWNAHWIKLGKHCYQTSQPHAKEEQILFENGLYTLDGYLRYSLQSPCQCEHAKI